jgi:small GTP-binding protein
MGKSFIFKILLTGDGAVGKTSIRERYMGRGFSGDYLKTIGADFASKDMKFEDDLNVKLQIFDLAGQDSYIAARKSFYKGGQAAFLVFDVQDPETLTNLSTWIEDSLRNSENSIQTFVALGNKADLADTRQVSPKMAVEFLQSMVAKHGLTFYYMDTSAKSGLNIEIAFDIMARRLLNKFNMEMSIPEADGVYEVAPGSGSGNVEKEVAAAVETVAQASNALIGGVVQEGSKTVERLAKIENALVKVVKKINLLEKKVERITTAVKGLMEQSAEDYDEAIEDIELDIEEEEKKPAKDFGVPSIPKSKGK